MRLTAFKLFAGALAFSAAALAGQSAGIWIDVPFVKQERNGCGAACVAMISEYWNKADDRIGSPGPQQVYQQLYQRQAHGIYASQMEAYFREHGFRVFAFRGTRDDLLHHLSKGRPLIVCLGDGHRGPLHYVVVAGLDPANQTVLVNDPARQKLLAMDRADFEERWASEDDWTLLAVPQ